MCLPRSTPTMALSLGQYHLCFMPYQNPALSATYLGDAVAEVLDVAADGPDGGQLLLLAEPLLHLDSLLVHHEDVDGEVAERLAQRAAGSLQWPKRGSQSFVVIFFSPFCLFIFSISF